MRLFFVVFDSLSASWERIVLCVLWSKNSLRCNSGETGYSLPPLIFVHSPCNDDALLNIFLNSPGPFSGLDLHLLLVVFALEISVFVS